MLPFITGFQILFHRRVQEFFSFLSSVFKTVVLLPRTVVLCEKQHKTNLFFTARRSIRALKNPVYKKTAAIKIITSERLNLF